MLILVVSDTSDRTHLGQKPSLARGFVSVSDSTITSFSWLLIEIDTLKEFSKKVQAYKKEGPKFLQRLVCQAEGHSGKTDYLLGENRCCYEDASGGLTSERKEKP
jgi:hypothetical protein